MALVRDAAYSFDERASNVLPLADSSVVWRHAALGLSGGRVRALQAGDTFAGFAGRAARSDRLATGAPPEQVPVIGAGDVLLAVPGVTAASVGASVYASGDDAFSLSGSSYIGRVLRCPADGSAWVAFDALGGGQASVSGGGISILPSGDTTGVTDRLTLEAAIASLPAAGGRITLGAGQWYFASKDVATTNTDPGPLLRAGVHVTGEGRRASRLRVVGGSKCNLFVADGIDGWSVTNLYLDGNRDDPLMPITGGSADNLRNCIRVKNSSDWEVRNCTLTRAAYHGLIGVGAVRNTRFDDNDCFLNGFRAVHIHDEGGSTPDIISVDGNHCWQNGQGIFPGFRGTGAAATAASAVVTVSAADATRLAQIYAAGITTVLVAIYGAGVSGATHYSAATLSAGNPSGTSLTLALPAQTTVAGAQIAVLAEMTSGIFVAYGCKRVKVAGNFVLDETAMGIHIADSATAVTSVVSVTDNIVTGCGIGMMLGSNDSNATVDITASGNKIVDSVFEGVQVNTVTSLTWDGEVVGSGTAGVRIITVGGGQQSIKISGVIRGCGANGVYARGGGELQSLRVTADIEDCGLNGGFTSSAATIYGAYGAGFGQGVLVNPDASSKFRSVSVTSDRIARCTNGASHINACDWAMTRVADAVDNAPASGGGAIAVRHSGCLGGGVVDTNARLRARTNSDYAVSVTGCTDSVLRGCRSNYTRATNIYYVAGTNCVAWDNIGPAGTSVQFGAGGAAASDAAMQRVA